MRQSVFMYADWRPPAVAFSIRVPRPVVFVCLIRGVELRGGNCAAPHVLNLSLFTDKINRCGCTNAAIFEKEREEKKGRIKRQPIVLCMRRKIKAAGYFQGVSNGSQHPGCISPRRPAVPLETLLVW